MSNTALLVRLALQATLQAQQYQMAIAKAAAEGREPTDEEVATARTSAAAAVDALASQG